MFFSVSNQCENNFTANYNVGPIWVNVDAGWSTIDVGRHLIVYKGYSDNYLLDNILDDILESNEPFDLGNYCVFVIDKKSHQIAVKTDRYRSFPIYVDSGFSVTNLQKKSYTVYTDSIITIHPDITIKEEKFDAIMGVKSSVLDYDEVIFRIDQIIRRKTQQFIANNRYPIKVHLSGGVDSLLVYSYLQAYTDKFELIKCAHIDYDRFWLLNDTDIQKYWGYNQIHHWTEACVLTSGTPGDEFMLRSPTTADLYLKARGVLMTDLLSTSQWKNCLHYQYFTQPKHLNIFNKPNAVAGDDLNTQNWNLCNTNINDWQHWHLGNTLTWTPLRDLEIFKLMLRLPLDHAIAQILDSKLSKDLIAQINPNFVKLISDQKNSDYPMKNLVDLLFN
jgi:hypothetical protein